MADVFGSMAAGLGDPDYWRRLAGIVGNTADPFGVQPFGMTGYGGGRAPLKPAAKSVFGSMNAGIRAYHGSPHDFDEFRSDKIGTGEGAQAYGHGLYFAQKEGVARNYRDALTTRAQGAGDEVSAAYAKVASPNGFLIVKGNNYSSPERVLRDVTAGHLKPDDLPEELAGAVRKYVSPGKMYEVNINANEDDFLDWDKPLSGQGPKAAQALQAELQRYLGPAYKGQISNYEGKAAGDILNESGAIRGDRFSKQAGIPGIKYLDQGSRGNVDTNNIRGTISMLETALRKTPNDEYLKGQLQTAKKQLAAADSASSRNFVVFDPAIIAIVKKYGIAGALGLGFISEEMGQAIEEEKKAGRI